MYLFVNYAPGQEGEVREIVQTLQSTGHTLWHDHYTIIGDDWLPQFERAMQEAEAVMDMLSRASVESTFCRWLVYRAILAGKRLVPMMLEAKIEIPFIYRGRALIDVSWGMSPLMRGRLTNSLKQYAYLIPPSIVPEASPPDEQPFYKDLLLRED